MKNKKKFTKETAEIVDTTLRILYETMSLQHVIQYLYTFLNEYFPITRIFCGFRVIDKPVFYPIADTINNVLEATKIPFEAYDTPEGREYFVPRNGLDPYFAIAPVFAGKTSKGITREEDFASHIRIPLFLQGERNFQLAICSNQKNVFNEAHLQLMKEMTHSLSKAMLLEQSAMSEKTSFEEIPKKSFLFKLQMCKGLRGLYFDITKLAPTDFTVLIEGETGVGKDIVAQNIHSLSPRNDKPFIKVNCAAINENLFESELFGHEKGAFTGALQMRKGYFEAANGGSIFLDEIGELSPRIQGALLRVLENRCIQKIGSSHEIPIDVRIIAATNKNLEKKISEGTFREDLLYRLNIYPLIVLPLRKHREDIPILVRYFVNSLISELGGSAMPSIPLDEMNKLYDHSWPGNIRELKNTVEKAVIQAREGNIFYPLSFNIKCSVKTTKEINKETESSELKCMEDFCNEYVKKILQHTGGKITGVDGAASILKLHPNTVRQYKYKFYNDPD